MSHEKSARFDPYQQVTDQILKHLENGVVPWRRPWRRVVGRPRNFQTGKPYHGINVLLLGWTLYESPWWMTFRQVSERGGFVRKGEHGTPIMKWGKYAPSKKIEEGAEKEKPRFYLKSYRVFNAAQIENVEFPPVEKGDGLDPEARFERGEAIYMDMPKPPTLRQSSRNRAAYSWKKDEVEMTPLQRFSKLEDYYLTLFHELVHSTGHPTRLDRKGVTESDGFGGKVYSQEELVAEMGAAFLAAEIDLVCDGHEQSAAYLKEWLEALRDPNHRRWVVTAASQAGRAADFILGRAPLESDSEAPTGSEEPVPVEV
jgi:antirestriction protein ArdC